MSHVVITKDDVSDTEAREYVLLTLKVRRIDLFRRSTCITGGYIDDYFVKR